MRTCDELGVCQHRTPPCSFRCAQPDHVVLPGATLSQATHGPYRNERRDRLVARLHRAADAAVVLLLLVVLAAALGFLLGYDPLGWLR